MESVKSISYYKSKARDQLLGNYGMAIGSFVIIFACFYAISSLLMGAYASSGLISSAISAGDSAITAVSPIVAFSTVASVKDFIINTLLGFVSGAFYAILMAGFYYVMFEISKGNKPQVSDVFYGFKNHPDKIIIIYLIIEAIDLVALLPSTIVSFGTIGTDGINGKTFLLYIILLVVGYVVVIYVSVTFAFAYICYLTNTEATPIECLKESARLIKGNKLRYIYIVLSLIGFYILGVFSFGIGMLYVIAYQTMIVINMYKDLAGDVVDED